MGSRWSSTNCFITPRSKSTEAKPKCGTGQECVRKCDILVQMERESDPCAQVWRGSDRPEDQLGLKVLGTPLGHPAYVQEQLEIIAAEHQQFLDLQCAWALLLHCGSARANYYLRVVRPECTVQFAALHDEGLWRCLCFLLDIPSDCAAGLIIDSVSLPLSLGGFGFRSATRSRVAAC